MRERKRNFPLFVFLYFFIPYDALVRLESANFDIYDLKVH